MSRPHSTLEQLGFSGSNKLLSVCQTLPVTLRKAACTQDTGSLNISSVTTTICIRYAEVSSVRDYSSWSGQEF
ncbi:hypothetical protein EB796_002746 [Bugula neritina]|uniref:Uncharacterized protein n=1 Tax=Bugula neritina TaxID=10212 RepID=A0A7J7KJR9_BUGNE|nr:hypothetical protein EB796_002746 [Bugula neritina]